MLRNALETHLASLKRQGEIEAWHDRRILAGQEFANEIDKNFEEADVILLLVSPDFIASDYCFDVEMARALQRHKAGEATVIPVILRICHWKELPFGTLLAATPDGKPVTQYPSLDEGFYLVVDSIKKAIQSRRSSLPTPKVGQNIYAISASSVETAAVTRSSNLRVKRVFTDQDKDQERDNCFKFVANFFSNSLEELASRNPSIKTSFKKIDERSFEASIYSDGKSVARCGIWISTEGFSRSELIYSSSGVTRGSYNESMSLVDDGYVLGFKPIGTSFSGREAKALLNFEGVSECFWDMLISPLQT
jgi:hypothetical protein